MAIKLPDGRIMRTLPEQVDKNMQDIASINNEVNVIKESITTAYKIQGSATVADLNNNTPDAAMNGYVYNMTDAGYLINSDESTTSVQIGDNVVLVWNEGNYFWDRLSGVVDTSNLVTLDSDQEITGVKDFVNGINFYTGTGRNWSFKTDSNFYLAVKRDNLNQYLFNDTAFIPRTTAKDLGESGNAWKDLYLAHDINLMSNTLTWKLRANSNNNALEFYVNDALMYYIKSTDLSPSTNASRDLGTNVLRWRSIYLSNYLNLSGFVDSTLRPRYNDNYDLGTSSNAWKDLYLSGNISDGTNSVTVAQISKTKLYKHQMTVSNVTGPVNIILTHNTPITGSFGANMSSQIVIAAYLTAQSNASQMKTPGGSLAQINNDGTITITVSAGETITADTVTEL